MKKISVEAEKFEKSPTTSHLIIEYLTKNKIPIPVSKLYEKIPETDRTIRHIITNLIRRGIILDEKRCQCGSTRLVELK